MYLKKVLEENYEMKSIGQAFEIARESIRRLGVSLTTVHQKKVWEMSKNANVYLKKESGFALPIKEKSDLLRKINGWIFEIEESERLERERIEKARLEKERLERLERERIEREKREQERLEAERLEKQSKEEFQKKDYVSAISLLEEAKEIYSKLGYQGKIGMIDKRIFQLKNLVKFQKQDTMVKTKGEVEFQKRVDKVLGEKERYNEKKISEQKALSPEIKQKIEKINLLIEKVKKEEKLGNITRVIGRYEYLLELYKSIPKDIINYSKEIYETEKKVVKFREKI